jgi:hypothetical protein
VTRPSQIDTRPSGAGGVELRVEEDPPPVVRALEGDLAERLADPAFAEATRHLRGAVSLRDATTPQSATIRLTGSGIALAHGSSGDAEIHATVALGDSGEPRIEGAAEHPELAEWLRALLSRPPIDWPQAAAEFWSALAGMGGAPAALRVVELETHEERRFGSRDGRAYEVHGPADDLVDVLSGRVPLVHAAFAGTVFVRGSFAELSVLAGAGFRVRYGPSREPGERADDA